MILNFTQHAATQDQISAGVVDVPEMYRNEAAKLLTFDDLPTVSELGRRADECVDLVCQIEKEIGDLEGVMIGGAPFFMGPLGYVLEQAGFEVFFAFSKRESVESMQPDGSIRKVAVFRHVGFVPFCG